MDNRDEIIRTQMDVIGTLLNNSLYEGCSLGGYLLLTYVGSDREEVQDWHFNTVCMDIERTRGHWRPGLFMGYAKQQSTTITTEKTVTHAFGRGWDIDYLWRVFLQLLMYGSAIFYTVDGFSPGMQLAFSLNPVYRHIDYFREIVLGGVVPSLETHLVLAGFALAALLAGVFMYKHYNTKFLYYV